MTTSPDLVEIFKSVKNLLHTEAKWRRGVPVRSRSAMERDQYCLLEALSIASVKYAHSRLLGLPERARLVNEIMTVTSNEVKRMTNNKHMSVVAFGKHPSVTYGATINLLDFIIEELTTVTA